MRQFIKRLLFPFLKRGLGKYSKKPRKYTYENITILVHPEVFPPHYTISTKILLDYLNPINLENKTVLELGCGSGIISLFCTSKGAKVTASDINLVAVSELEKNATDNNLELNILHSDLFDNIDNTTFDYIIINPPYYPKTPLNDKEKAWFCGENFEYFKKLFSQLSLNIADNTLMILSEDCDIETITNIAVTNNLNLKRVYEKTVLKEKNYIFKILKTDKLLNH